MTGIEAAAASAALSPTKGFVDALLGPMLERVRRWSIDKDLRAQLKPDNINSVVKRYLERTLTSAAGIQSIVFPQQELLLSEVYEPLLLETVAVGNKKSRTLTATELLRAVGHATVVDQAGMGKSTYAKFLTTHVCNITDKIPIAYNLRHYQAAEPLTKALLKEFHEFDREFGESLFNKLLVLGKFFIILDGFDEVNAAWQSDVRREIEMFAVKCGGTRIVLTTRPQANVPILAGGKQYRFCRLRLQQAHSLVQRYDKFAGIEVGARLIQQMQLVPVELLETPLLVALLYRTFGVNNTIADGIAAFYSDTYEALFRGHDLTKAGFSRTKESGLNIDEFRRALQLISFHSIIKSQLSWENESELVSFVEQVFTYCNKEPALARKVVNDLLRALSLFVEDGNEVKYIHKTFAEYFAAEFVTRSPDSGQVLEKLRDSKAFQALNVVFDFINELSPALARRAFIVPAARYISGIGLSEAPSEEETVTRCFSWEMRWGTDADVHDLVPEEIENSVGIAGTELVVNGRTADFVLIGWPAKKLDRLPAFGWAALSMRTDNAREVKFVAEAKVELAKIIMEFPRGRSRLSNDDLLRLMKNPVFLDIIRYAVRAIAGVVTDYASVWSIDSGRCREVLAVEEMEVKQLGAIDEILACTRAG